MPRVFPVWKKWTHFPVRWPPYMSYLVLWPRHHHWNKDAHFNLAPFRFQFWIGLPIKLLYCNIHNFSHYRQSDSEEKSVKANKSLIFRVICLSLFLSTSLSDCKQILLLYVTDKYATSSLTQNSWSEWSGELMIITTLRSEIHWN